MRAVATLLAALVLAPAATAQTINTPTPLIVDLSGSTRPMQTGTGLGVRCANDAVCRILVEGFGANDPLLTLQTGAGSAANPTPPASGLLGSINFRGWDGSVSDRQGFSYGAVQFRAWVSEPWDLTHHGAFATLSTTPKANGATNGAQDLTRQTWWDDGRVSFNAYAAGNASFGQDGIVQSSPSARAAPGGFVGLGPVADYTLSNGVITITGSRARVDTPGSGTAGDLIGIVAVGVQDGDLLLIQSKDGAHVITAKDQAAGGNLQLAGDFVMANPSYKLVLIYQSSNNCWIELSRSNNG